MLRVDPRQRKRLVEVTDNLQQRLDEAIQHRWLREVQGLQISLDAARAKLTAVDRTARKATSGPTFLGLPNSLCESGRPAQGRPRQQSERVTKVQLSWIRCEDWASRV
jgi:hypothetical protein